MKKVFKKILVSVSITIILPFLINWNSSIYYLPQVEAENIQVAKLVKTEGTMGVGSFPIGIQIENEKYDAKYTFTSANKRIASVSEDNGIIYGCSVGKTTITVQESYQGKTKKIGTYAINVIHAQIVEKEMEIGLSSYNTIALNYRNESATYHYKSSDSKVVKIEESRYLTGLKYGTATITVMETFGGKTIKIGTCSVAVTKSKLTVINLEVPIYEGPYNEVPIECRNFGATYQYKSSDPKVVTVNDNGTFSGLKVGKATVSVTETFNKKMRKLGSITINVSLASIDPKCKLVVIGVNSSSEFDSMIDQYYDNSIPILNKNLYAKYTCKSTDNNIVSVENNISTWDSRLVVRGVGIGTTTLSIYEDYKGKERKVGTVKVEVKEFPVTDFLFHNFDSDDFKSIVKVTYSMGRIYSLQYSYIIRPINCTTPISFTSSDETIVTVDNKGDLTPIKVGTVEITATCGMITDKIIVTIVPEE